MTTPALVRAELGRLTATPLARVAFIALMIVPLLYGGLYLWANQNPYAKLDHVPAALVVNDTGATVDGHHVDYGEQVAKQTVRDGSFDWTVTSASAAASGIKSGRYDFVVTIPAAFSQDLASASDSDPQRAELVMTTSDANSYLASTIAEQAGKTMRTSVSEQVGKRAAKTLLVGLADIRTNLLPAVRGSGSLASGLGTAESGAQQLAAGTGKLSSGASQLASGTADLPAQTAALASGASQVASGSASVASGAASLDAGLDQLRSQTASLPSSTQQLATGAARVAAGNQQLAATFDPVLNGVAALSPTTLLTQIQAALPADAALTPAQQAAIAAALQNSTLQQQITGLQQQSATLRTQLDQLASGSAQVSSGAASLATATPTLTNGIARLDDGAGTLSSGAAQVNSGAAAVSSGASALAKGATTLSSGASSLAAGAATADSGATSLASGLDTLHAGAVELHTSLKSGRNDIPASNASTRNAQASVISDPVRVADQDIANAGTYGAGLAPFFISLAAWIGMYALFLILRPISRRAITAVRKPLPITLGAWLTPALLGLVQMLALFAIVRFALGFGVEHVAGTIAVMVLASVTFAAIIMMLNVLLGSVGQFLGLVLMLIQLVTAGGTFPWQTLPAPLAALHFALPMSYSVDAIRQLMYGGSVSAAWSDSGVLACWLLGALVVTALVAGRQSRFRTLRDLRPSLIG
ncbi:YhgE/Pip domain-containing protein [Curtobacterium sp. MCBD17_019]|uniref:YhgE/Pip domain-containing protein n=1 Tax=Curtobacterium sp. MCBD17_019 TaxID=2175669 RepID=UPI000DA9676A|nr:YhgE/Pip domain-containing protein [Curtobacterium sp. MCBD17_019]PZE78314.1 YhgE/Pip domain-containing protein [Curtobacterium sp. MCBD17_019]